MNNTISRVALLVPLALAAGVLAGCTALGGDDPDAAANDAAAAKFVACLTAAGQTAKIIDSGQVGLLMPEMSDDDGTTTMTGPPPGEEGAPMAAVSVFMDDEGAWMAGSSAEIYPEEGGMREAWADCEAAVPEFEQPEPDMSGAEMEMVSREDMIEASLAFAACARDEGYADFADPDENGMLDFPLGISEDEFRALLEACMEEEGIGLPVSRESAESFDFDWMAIMMEYGGTNMGVAVPAEPVN